VRNRLSDAIRLTFILVAGPPKHQLGLNRRRGSGVLGLEGVIHDLLHVVVTVPALQPEQRSAGTGEPAAARLT
jgi:hypothetical protein